MELTRLLDEGPLFSGQHFLMVEESSLSQTICNEIATDNVKKVAKWHDTPSNAR